MSNDDRKPPARAVGRPAPEPEAPGAANEQAPELVALRARLGYEWRDGALLEEALRHRSAAHELGRPDNERLEFLGDAVLGLVTADWLLQRYPAEAEGQLARKKSFLVSQQSLAAWAESLELAEALALGVGEARSGGGSKPALLADALEAILGAVFLDGGLEPARRLLEPLLERQLERAPDLAGQDVKTQLQELLQSEGKGLPEYRLLEASGPDHAKSYLVECRVGALVCQGRASSKKHAEREAARLLLAQLERGAG